MSFSSRQAYEGSICMKTIKTAAYAALAATTSKGLLIVAVIMTNMKATTKAVIILNLTLLPEKHSSSPNGTRSMTKPPAIILRFVNVSNFASLEYVMVDDLTCFPSTKVALNSFDRCKVWKDSSHRPSAGRVRELMDIKSGANLGSM